ncbi:glycosyltransferase [Paenibacillus medicaginis]|uniref:Glycosyltransferase n=1 Tax=Paenibacillus medicaginis TaxID=1470560 RepID=A0ABV5C3Q7_9BACL
MVAINILFITGDFSKYLADGTYHLLNELKKRANIAEWHQPGDIHEIIAKLDQPPDFVFVNEFGETNCPVISGLDTLTLPFAIYVHDIHYNHKQRNEEMKNIKVKYIFTRYRDGFKHFYPDLSPLMRWLPQHAPTTIFYDYALPKDIDMLLMGSTDQHYYPLRFKIYEKLKNESNFLCHPHPGYRNIEENEHQSKQVLVRENYAQEINRAKLFFTCDSILHYPITKYFEVPSCNTLLLAPAIPELYDLGFIPDQHFVDINEDNFVEKAQYYLDHEEERIQIARNGYELVQNYHSSAKRAEMLLAEIKDILNKTNDLSTFCDIDGA